jgi:Transposase zinc-binding domain/Putative transposase
VPQVVHKFLDCGNLDRGFARIRCDHCQHEYLLAFSCKSRWFCPTCHQKNVQTTAAFLTARVLASVPHRHYVLAIPKMLRPYFQRHRPLLKNLCALGHQSLTEYLRTALGRPDAHPAVILTLHTFGEYLDFHPHVHALVAAGLFTRDGTFHPLPELPLKPLEELFRAHVLKLLVDLKLLPPERVQVLHSWKHSGFNVHSGEPVPPENKAELEKLAP